MQKVRNRQKPAWALGFWFVRYALGHSTGHAARLSLTQTDQGTDCGVGQVRTLRMQVLPEPQEAPTDLIALARVGKGVTHRAVLELHSRGNSLGW